MILNRFLIVLFYSLAHVLASEILTISDLSSCSESIVNFKEIVIKVARSPRHEKFHIGAIYDRFSVKQYLNSLDLGDTEDEEEAAEDLSGTVKFRDLITLSLHPVNEGPIFESTLDLNEELFAAAVESFEVDRLRRLLAKRKHFLLNSEQKMRIFDKARMNCEYENYFTTTGNILKMLLQAGFYPSDGIWPKSEKYPWISVFRDRRLYQPFLNYDGEFFAREKKFNYVAKLIEWERYSQAKRALLLGCDPKIIVDETGGRNALDFALDVPFPLLKPNLERIRRDLIRIFQEEYGMNISNTIENLGYICKQRDWDRAIELIRLGGMKFKDVSPIGVSFKHNNTALLNAAIETYLHELTVDQLNSDLAVFYAKRFKDENEMMPFLQAVERIFRRINSLSSETKVAKL